MSKRNLIKWQKIVSAKQNYIKRVWCSKTPTVEIERVLQLYDAELDVLRDR